MQRVCEKGVSRAQTFACFFYMHAMFHIAIVASEKIVQYNALVHIFGMLIFRDSICGHHYPKNQPFLKKCRNRLTFFFFLPRFLLPRCMVESIMAKLLQLPPSSLLPQLVSAEIVFICYDVTGTLTFLSHCCVKIQFISQKNLNIADCLLRYNESLQYFIYLCSQNLANQIEDYA